MSRADQGRRRRFACPVCDKIVCGTKQNDGFIRFYQHRELDGSRYCSGGGTSRPPATTIEYVENDRWRRND